MKVQIYEGQQARISGGRAGGLGRGSLSGLFMETVRSPPVQEARPQVRGPRLESLTSSAPSPERKTQSHMRCSPLDHSNG